MSSGATKRSLRAKEVAYTLTSLILQFSGHVLSGRQLHQRTRVHQQFHRIDADRHVDVARLRTTGRRCKAIGGDSGERVSSPRYVSTGRFS